MQKNKKKKIFVVTHKEFSPPEDPLYQPIQVGRYFTKKDLGYISDDTGSSIAEKNKNYCELTALYWIWKNVKGYDYIGLCHYRRYFTKCGFLASSLFFLKERDLDHYFSEYDIIVPQKFYWKDHTVEEYYGICEGRSSDLEILKKIVAEKFPEYLEAYEKIMNAREAFYCNMFITSFPILNEYCEWLFSVLDEAERRCDLTGYSQQEARIYGYMSELLLNVWIEKKGLRYKEISVVNMEAGRKKTALDWGSNRMDALKSRRKQRKRSSF